MKLYLNILKTAVSKEQDHMRHVTFSLDSECQILSNPLISFGEKVQGKETISVRINF